MGASTHGNDVMMRRVQTTSKSYFGELSIARWESPLFVVAAYNDHASIRLDIIRKDLQDGILWDEIQTIKRQCGFGEHDALELFPAESSMINTGNARHIFVLPERSIYTRTDKV
jgi:tRNA uridine 5-carbamoylmethylation protein Kti12